MGVKRDLGVLGNWKTAFVQMETDLRLESSLWVGNKRYLAVLTGWHFKWTEVDKKNRDKKTGNRIFTLGQHHGI